MSWLRSVPAVGACCTVKVGNLRLAGMLPVVNARGVETVPLSRTCLISYVVFGSMPATMKLVLCPGTMGIETVLRQVREGACWANSTCIDAPVEGGALYRAIRGLDMGEITALLPTIRVCAVYVAVADSPVE